MNSMMLIPTRAGRPAIVTLPDGVRVYVGVRDAAFEQGARALYRKMCDMHPDKITPHLRAIHCPTVVTGYRYRRQVSILGQWLARQFAHYQQLNLTPPNWEHWGKWCADYIHKNSNGDLRPNVENIALRGDYAHTQLERRIRTTGKGPWGGRRKGGSPSPTPNDQTQS